MCHIKKTGLIRCRMNGILPLSCLLIINLFLWEACGMNASEIKGNITVAENVLILLDRKNLSEGWITHTGQGAELLLSSTNDPAEGELLRLKYNTGKTHSYALAARDYSCTLPNRFELRARLCFTEPQNHMEFKLMDDHGNTFMKKWYRFGSVGLWQDVMIDQKEFLRVWGPDADAKLKSIKTVELGITGADCSGEVLLSRLEIHPLPPDTPPRKSGRHDHGCCPRWLFDCQAYWTLTGVEHDDNEALICEDGALEPVKRGPSVLPVVLLNGKRITRNEVKTQQELAENVLPVPSVIWEHDAFSLTIDLIAHGTPGQSVASARYTLTNKSAEPLSGKLLLLIEPYQIYPPWQGGGGFAPIRDISFSNRTVCVNGNPFLITAEPPDNFSVFDENGNPGGIADAAAQLPQSSNHIHELSAPDGFAAGALAFDFNLESGTSMARHATFPLHGDKTYALPSDDRAADTFEHLRMKNIEFWNREIRRVDLQVNEPGLTEAFFAGIGYNLITRDGPALQPGSRSYDKAWMRDGSIAAVALLEAGHTNAAREFIEWFAGFQLNTGEIPPIIDTKAEDPLWEEKEKGLVEYDSQGEFVWLVMQYYRFTKDRAFLEAMFPHVLKALQFLETLRAQRTTGEYRDESSEKHLCYGILPESTSHEGYYMKHSYWDDFWGIKGWEDGIEMAGILQRDDLLDGMRREYCDFKTCVLSSIQNLGTARGIDYMPGCVELADLDPTSTAAAVIYCDLLGDLPPDRLNATYNRLMDDVAQRLTPGAEYRFTPYEMRNIGALLRMGRREDALTLLRFQLNHMRPSAWRHFAEVAHSDERFPCYIGDMPHTWVCAEYMHGIRNLFLYEENQAIILGAGIDPAWVNDHATIRFTGFPTWYGPLSARWERLQDGTIHIHIDGQAVPPNGFILRLPDAWQNRLLTINDAKQLNMSGPELTFRTLPADILLTDKTNQE